MESLVFFQRPYNLVAETPFRSILTEHFYWGKYLCNILWNCNYDKFMKFAVKRSKYTSNENSIN